MQGEINRLQELRLGGVSLEKLIIVFADAHTFRQLEMDDRPAILLGMNALRAFELVSIDFSKRRMRVRLPGRSELSDDKLASR